MSVVSLTRLLIPIAAFVIGWMAGSHTLRHSSEGSALGIESRSANSPVPTEKEIGDVSVTAANPKDRRVLAEALQGPWNLERQRALIDWASRLTPSEIAAAVEVANQLPHTQKDKLLALLGARWAEIDPEAALKFASQYKDESVRPIMSAAVVEVWMDRDPKAAVAFVLSLHQSGASVALVPLARILADRDVAGTRELFDHLKDASLRTALAWSIMPSIANSKNPIAAVDFAASLQGHERERLLTDAVQAWAATDGPGVLAWISEHSKGSERNALTQAALTKWATNDPRAAVEYWSNNERSDVSGADETMAGLLYQWAWKEPDSALTWARTLSDNGTRDLAIQQVITQMALADPQRAIEAATTLPATTQPNVKKRLAFAWSNTAPEAAATWVAGWSDSAQQLETLRAILADWTASDPQEASTWVNTLAKGPLQDSAISGLAPSLAEVDSESAAAWACAIADEAYRREAIEKVTAEWIKRDPDAARAWLDARPDVSPETKAKFLPKK
jgi:hypothetical protein